MVPPASETATDPAAVSLLSLVAKDQVRVVFDAENFDFHADVAPNADPRWTKFLVGYLTFLGYELLDDDECEPEVLDDDWVRCYFVPVEPAEDDQHLISPPQVSA
ncbi:hypothetical protein [Saccharothrix sp. HUAS TT1]|uniref:hypothetical protein n=1 Tax=unclassified Saccharothrix TaxID=2593673 RepID=UPI00345BD75C